MTLDHLKRLIRRHVRRGDFPLSSGRRSEWYVDLRPLTLSAGVWSLAVELDFVRATQDVVIDAVGGPSVGADPLVGAMLYRGSIDRGFLVRSGAKSHGVDADTYVIGSVREGDRCMVVDDVTTTGDSLLLACHRVRKERGAIPTVAVSVLDREEGAAETFARAGIPFVSLVTLKDVTEGDDAA